MSASSSSCSPSSSAVTIPIPGKSILKRPQPVQPSLLSRITRFLPAQNSSSSTDESEPLKRAHFILPQLVTVYPISSVNPPSTPTLKEEKKAIEDREAERRKRVVRGGGGSTSSSISDADEWWSMDKVESFYRECCAGAEEEPDPAITFAFKNTNGSRPRSVDMSGVQVTVNSASILSDVFSIEWGLRKLVLRECDLDEHNLKPILHALLIPGTLSFLSVASNRRLKSPSFRLIGAYLSNAKTMQFLDLSQNSMDKKSVEYLTAALPTAPTPGLVSLRMDDCSLRPAGLEVLARGVRTSSLRNISLRHNRITATGAVALAIMIRDYPDVVPPSTSSSLPPSPSPSVLSFTSPPATPITPTTPSNESLSLSSTHISPALPSPISPRPGLGHVVPPPRHPPPPTPQTTYTPYVPRARRGAPSATSTTSMNPLSPSGQPIPIITSSSQGGVTTRHTTTHETSALSKHEQGPSAALLDKVRALDALPRVGALRTLDLKGNDLRSGVAYIAQVLKRNRTLKVLNLSENKLDVQCLVAIAEALKYNSSLETLDLSKNPCSGPTLDGIQSLRTAFTLNTALKRLFLSSTSMTSAGAIALAEFLPESTSLLHLDLTLNNIDIAGVMALSSGLKANRTMRCLDLNIPPGDEEFARMCRDILNTCVRNTEDAEKHSHVSAGSNVSTAPRGHGKGVWGMIDESELAKRIRQDEAKKLETDVVTQAHVCISHIRGEVKRVNNIVPEHDVYASAKSILIELSNAIQTTSDPIRLEELLGVNDDLTAALAEKTKSTDAEKTPLALHGLGLELSSSTEETRDGDMNGEVLNGNGEAVHDSPVGVDEEPSTPRVDKGKAKAEPEPEELERVLSPTSSMVPSGSDEEEEEEEDGQEIEVGEGGEDVVDIASPTLRSKSWIEEEGEVFRKGNVLLGPEEMEGEYDGDELRRELLEAMVERPPPRPIDEFENGVVHSPVQMEPGPVSPPLSPSQEPKKPPPRPYVSRSRSSSSLSLASQIQATQGGVGGQQVEGVVSPSPNSATSQPPTPSSVA